MSERSVPNDALLTNKIHGCYSNSYNSIAKLFGSIPIVSRMIGYDQNNPHHCYDLYDHTIHTLEALPEDSDHLLQIAALLHDIGKPDVAKEKNDRLVFYGHAQKSAELAKDILSDMCFSSNDIEMICLYISHHDDFISWVLSTDEYNHNNLHLKEINHKNVSTYINSITGALPSNENLKHFLSNLLLLCEADVMAQAEIVYMNGMLVDSREHKLRKLYSIKGIIDEVLSDGI